MRFVPMAKEDPDSVSIVQQQIDNCIQCGFIAIAPLFLPHAQQQKPKKKHASTPIAAANPCHAMFPARRAIPAHVGLIVATQQWCTHTRLDTHTHHHHRRHSTSHSHSQRHCRHPPPTAAAGAVTAALLPFYKIACRYGEDEEVHITKDPEEPDYD